MANKRLQIQAVEIEELMMKFCDLNCEYGDWPEDNSLDGSRSCRTFQALSQISTLSRYSVIALSYW
jgi:hypothetical protein